MHFKSANNLMNIIKKLLIRFQKLENVIKFYIITYVTLSMFLIYFKHPSLLYLFITNIPYLVMTYKYRESLVVKFFTVWNHIAIVLILLGYSLINDPESQSMKHLESIKYFTNALINSFEICQEEFGIDLSYSVDILKALNDIIP